MDNFVYSIQLNDRDWAEFYLASEECNLIQPALATAEEQLLSDLEEGEVEEGRLIRGRVDPALAHHSSASLLPCAAPDGHLPAEDVWSGSEDETDLGSVNRFLCKTSQLGTACPQSSGTQENRLSCVTLTPPPGSQPGSATERDIPCAAKERESEIGDQPSSLSVAAASAVEKEDLLPGLNPKQEVSERLACNMHANLDASERMEDNPAGEKGSGSTLCLALKLPKDDASQAASDDNQLPTLQEKNTAVGGNPEFLEPRELAGRPRSVHFPSPDSIKHKGAEHLDRGTTTTRQVTLTTQAVPGQEEPPVFGGHSVPVMRILAPADPLSESRVEGVEGRNSQAEKDDANLRGEGRVDCSEGVSCDVLKEERPLDQVVSPTWEVVGPEDNKYLRAASTADDSKTWDERRDTASLKRGPEKEINSGEPCHRLGMAVPLEEDSHVLAPGSQRADFFRESIRCCPALENSPDSDVTFVTWPEMYDYFFCDDTQEQGGKMRERMGKEKLLDSNTDPHLPEMYGPEMYEYFFNEMGEAKARGGSGDKGIKVEKISSSGHQPAPPGGSEDPDSDAADSPIDMSVPEVYEHFFVSRRTKDKRTWRGFFLSMPALEAKKAARALKSLVCKPAHRLRSSQPTGQGALLRRGSHGRLVLLSPRLLEENQPRAEDPAMAVMIPERPLQPVFSQRDMCLGFVAFASWAVKTSNLQAPDAWKIVFLANFGTLSAIRYFRRQVVTGGQHGT